MEEGVFSKFNVTFPLINILISILDRGIRYYSGRKADRVKVSVSLPRRRSWGFVTRSCPTNVRGAGTRDEG